MTILGKIYFMKKFSEITNCKVLSQRNGKKNLHIIQFPHTNFARFLEKLVVSLLWDVTELAYLQKRKKNEILIHIDSPYIMYS